MKTPSQPWRVALVALLASLFTLPLMTQADAASAGVIKACVEKSTQSIVISSSCVTKTQTAISWKKAARSDSVIKVCVARASFVTKWSANNNCGKNMLVKWTVNGSATTTMTGCVDKATNVLIYSPMDWCVKTSYKLSWLRTIASKSSSTTTTPNSQSPSTSTSPTTTVAVNHSTTTTAAPTGSFIGTQFGSSDWDGLTSGAVDADGNVYASGYVCAPIAQAQVIGNGTGTCGALVTKHSATDELLWMKILNFNDGSGSGSLSLSTNGAIYVTASTTIGADRDITISKFDTDGTNVWNATVGTPTIDRPNAIAVDASDHIYIAGETQGDFSDPSVSHAWNQSDVFVIKLHWASASIHTDWSRTFGSTERDAINEMTLTPIGQVAISGSTRGVMPNSGSSTPNNIDAVFVSVLDVSGAVQWTLQWSGVNSILSGGLTADNSGSLYFCGSTVSDMRNLSIDRGDLEAFVVKLNASNGSVSWTRMFGSTSNEYLNGVVADTDGNLLIAGYTDGTIAGATLSSKEHPFIVKMNNAGNFIWKSESAVAGNDSTYVWAVAPDPRGGAVLLGESNINFGAMNVDQVGGSSDALFIRVTTAGAFPAKHN